MNLYLIRHGVTEANARHLYCGSTDLPLLTESVEELSKRQYSVVPGCRFITSGMRRTEQTLECLFGKVEHIQDPRFREIDFGVFEMHSYEELKDREDYQAWISGENERNIPPGGESSLQMRERVMEGIRELLAKGQDTVVICHGGVVAAIMEELFPEEEKNLYLWQPKPGYGYWIKEDGYEMLI